MAVFNLRGVRDDLARAVKATAASEGKTLVEFITDVFERDIKRGGWTAVAKLVDDASQDEGPKKKNSVKR